MRRQTTRVLMTALGAVLLWQTQAHAGAKITIDETKWLSVGAGLRASYSALEDAAPNGDEWSNDFNLDNARLYFNGAVHEYVKFELNTECAFCGNSDLQQFIVLDGIAKFELSPYFNIWGGRLLVPAERQEMNGPFFSSIYDAFTTPFFSADFSTHYGVGGAGIYERDNGVNVWGAAGPGGAFQYVAGVFTGLQSAPGSGPNQGDAPLFGLRLAYNFLNVEKNPGYYTSGEYFGEAGDILTLGFAFQHQNDGAGSFEHPSNFSGIATDLLWEWPTSAGVVDVSGEFKHFMADYSELAFTDDDPNKFLMFDGSSFNVTALFMFPEEIGIGKIQPFTSYSGIYPDNSADRQLFQIGVNYPIAGFNARPSLWYEYGDLLSLGLNYAPGATGDNLSAFRLGVQIQL